MKYGCRAHDYGRHTAEELAAILEQNGYGAAQLALNKAIVGIDRMADVTPDQLEAVRTAFDRHHIEITVLGCYRDLSNPDDTVRRAAVEDVFRALAFQQVLHAGVVGSESACRDLTEEEKAATLPLLTDSVLRIVEKAAALGGVFGLEPVFVHTVGTAEKVQTLLDRVADPDHFKIIFDPVNVLTADHVAVQTEFWTRWSRVIGNRLATVHIKDARFPAEGPRIPTGLGAGQMDYTVLRQWLHRDYPDVTLLRDEVILSCAEEDLAYIRRM